MTFAVIGFMGRAGSGKDLCGNYIADNYRMARVALADVIKRFCSKVFEFTNQQLWGPSEYRNEEVSIDWKEAEYNLYLYMRKWVHTLPIEDRYVSDYMDVLENWFADCKSRGSLSPRVALQLLGTEYGRKYKDSMWVDYLFDNIVEKLKNDRHRVYEKEVGTIYCGTPPRYNGIVITDARFNNEMEAIQKRGGEVIRLIRISQEGTKTDTDEKGLKGHASEQELQSIPLTKFNHLFRMEEGEDFVHKTIDNLMTNFYGYRKIEAIFESAGSIEDARTLLTSNFK